MSTILSLIVDNLDPYEHFIIISSRMSFFFFSLLVSKFIKGSEKKNPKIYIVPNVLPMCPRGPVGDNVFLVSSECLFRVESCVIHDNFNCNCRFHRHFRSFVFLHKRSASEP